MFNVREWSKQANIIADVLSKAPKIDKNLRVDRAEFECRQKAVYQALHAAGFDGGIVYSDEHYHGDVPYLGGNTNISVEPVSWARTVLPFWPVWKAATWQNSCPPEAAAVWDVWKC